MKRLKAAVVGMGFIGAAHVEALHRIPYVDVVAIADAFGAKEKAERRLRGLPGNDGCVQAGLRPRVHAQRHAHGGGDGRH